MMDNKTISDICEEFMEEQANAEQDWDDTVSALTDFVEELLDDQRKACAEAAQYMAHQSNIDIIPATKVMFACTNAKIGGSDG